jgi:hypothetical protein
VNESFKHLIIILFQISYFSLFFVVLANIVMFGSIYGYRRYLGSSADGDFGLW